MRVTLGEIVAPYGIKGEVKVLSCTDFAKERYKKGNQVILNNPKTNDEVIFNIASYKNIKGMDVISFEGKEDINLVLKYIGYEVLIERNEKLKEKDNYFYSDLLNCQVIYNDEIIGNVINIIDNGIHYLLRIKRTDKKDLLYPFVEKFIEKIDVENKKIYLNPIKGMIE